MENFIIGAAAVLSFLAALFYVASQVAGWGRTAAAKRASFAFRIAFLSCVWFACSSTIVISNRVLFGLLGGRFSFPFTITLFHMLIKGVLAAAAVGASSAFLTPDMMLLPPLQRLRARAVRALDVQGLTRSVVWRLVVPMGVASAVDVALSNEALKLAGVAVYTVAKSTSLVWNLAFSLSLRLVPLSCRLISCVVLVALGVGLCAASQLALAAPARDGGAGDGGGVWGASAAIGAALAAAVRWVLSEAYFSRQGLREPPSVLLLLALLGPVSALALTPGVAWEMMGGGGGGGAVAMSALGGSVGDVGVVLGATLGVGSVAFLLVLAEQLLVAAVGALSVNMVSHFKDAVMIPLGVVVFGEQLGAEGAAGAALALLGTFAYTAVKAGGDGKGGGDGGGGGASEEGGEAARTGAGKGGARGARGTRGSSEGGEGSIGGGGGSGGGGASSHSWGDGVDTSAPMAHQAAAAQWGYAGLLARIAGGGGRPAYRLPEERGVFDDWDEEEEAEAAVAAEARARSRAAAGVAAAGAGAASDDDNDADDDLQSLLDGVDGGEGEVDFELGQPWPAVLPLPAPPPQPAPPPTPPPPPPNPPRLLKQPPVHAKGRGKPHAMAPISTKG